MSDNRVEELAKRLMAAEDERELQDPLTVDYPDLSEEEAYQVQDRTLQMREERGEKLVGLKLGLTSKAKQERMNVDTPLVGWMTDAHYLEPGEPIPTDRFIQPRVEPEIFVTLKKPLEGPNVTIEDVRDAVDYVYAGLDVIDSRYKAYKFTHKDVVADNSSGAGFIVGPIALRVDDLDLALESVTVEVDGQVVDTATGAAILGHPLAAVAFGANVLAERGRRLEAGQIVLAGALTDAIPVDAGKAIAFHFSNLGSIYLPGAA